jgi:hypothetical protein
VAGQVPGGAAAGQAAFGEPVLQPFGEGRRGQQRGDHAAQAVALEAELVGVFGVVPGEALFDATAEGVEGGAADQPAGLVVEAGRSFGQQREEGIGPAVFGGGELGEVDAQGRAGEQGLQALRRVGDGQGGEHGEPVRVAAVPRRAEGVEDAATAQRVLAVGVAQHDEVAAAGVQRCVGDELGEAVAAGGEAGFFERASSSATRPPSWRVPWWICTTAPWARARGASAARVSAMSRRWAGSGAGWPVSQSPRRMSSTASPARLRAQRWPAWPRSALRFCTCRLRTRAPGPQGRGGRCRPPRPGPHGRCRRRWCRRRRG